MSDSKKTGYLVYIPTNLVTTAATNTKVNFLLYINVDVLTIISLY